MYTYTRKVYRSRQLYLVLIHIVFCHHMLLRTYIVIVKFNYRDWLYFFWYIKVWIEKLVKIFVGVWYSIPMHTVCISFFFYSYLSEPNKYTGNVALNSLGLKQKKVWPCSYFGIAKNIELVSVKSNEFLSCRLSFSQSLCRSAHLVPFKFFPELAKKCPTSVRHQSKDK